MQVIFDCRKTLSEPRIRLEPPWSWYADSKARYRSAIEKQRPKSTDDRIRCQRALHTLVSGNGDDTRTPKLHSGVDLDSPTGDVRSRQHVLDRSGNIRTRMPKGQASEPSSDDCFYALAINGRCSDTPLTQLCMAATVSSQYRAVS